MSQKMREVEYFRCWGGDHGTWDTDFISIPADTADDKLDEAVRAAAAAVEWRDDEVPSIVGYYCESESMDDDDGVAEADKAGEFDMIDFASKVCGM